MKIKCVKFFLISIFLLLLPLATSCYGSWNFFYEGNNVDKRSAECKFLNGDSEFIASHIESLGPKYTVLIITDTHFGTEKKPVNCEILFNYLRSIRGTPDYPSFVICLGDATELGKPEHFAEYNHFCDTLISQFGLNIVLNACGNHDIYQNNWANWEENCYPHTSFYTFHTKKFSWYCLDTASGTVGENQYRKLNELFDYDSRPKIIYTHYPFTRFNYDCSNMAETTERNKLISDFSHNKVLCVLGGHNHTQTFDDLGYKDYGIPSFAYDEVWGLLHVDEDAEDVYLDFIGG